MRLTHRHIEVFRTVMLAGQVTRAAELLHTSQPTVSRELARLEQLVGAARAAATHPRGIVMAAGNLNYLANAFVTVFVLRRFHGCKLPMTLA